MLLWNSCKIRPKFEVLNWIELNWIELSMIYTKDASPSKSDFSTRSILPLCMENVHEHLHECTARSLTQSLTPWRSIPWCLIYEFKDFKLRFHQSTFLCPTLKCTFFHKIWNSVHKICDSAFKSGIQEARNPLKFTACEAYRAYRYTCMYTELPSGSSRPRAC